MARPTAQSQRGAAEHLNRLLRGVVGLKDFYGESRFSGIPNRQGSLPRTSVWPTCLPPRRRRDRRRIYLRADRRSAANVSVRPPIVAKGVGSRSALTVTECDCPGYPDVSHVSRRHGREDTMRSVTIEITLAAASSVASSSQMRSAVQQWSSRREFVSMSRSTFRRSLGIQYLTFVDGNVPCSGHWYQNHPSKNTTTRAERRSRSA